MVSHQPSSRRIVASFTTVAGIAFAGATAALERAAGNPEADEAPIEEVGPVSEWDDGSDQELSAQAHSESLPAVAALAESAVEETLAGQPSYADEVQTFMDEFLDTSRAIAGRAGGDDTVRLGGGSRDANWFDALVVTHRSNPLLEEECKKNALQLSLETLRNSKNLDDHRAALEAATRHMHEQVDFVQSHGISYAGYLEHVAECKAFCGPLVAQLLQCQVLAVSRSPHGVILFELDSDEVNTRYERGILARITEMLEESPRSRAVLIGRASRIGDLRYNRRLAARRTLAVRDQLIGLGTARNRIKTMWFGWEPPQINESIAAEYGLAAVYAAEGHQRINQSVVVVVYEPDPAAQVAER